MPERADSHSLPASLRARWPSRSTPELPGPTTSTSRPDISATLRNCPAWITVPEKAAIPGQLGMTGTRHLARWRSPRARPRCCPRPASAPSQHRPGQSGGPGCPAAAASPRRSPAGRPRSRRGRETARSGAGSARQADARTSGEYSAEDGHDAPARTRLPNLPGQPRAGQDQPGRSPRQPPGLPDQRRRPRHAHPRCERGPPYRLPSTRHMIRGCVL